MSETCKYTVFGDRVQSWPCQRKAVKDGYCKQHHPDSFKARHEASNAKYKAAWNARLAESKAKAEQAEQQRKDAARYRGLRDLAKEMYLHPKTLSSEFPDQRTHWQLPILICSGPVGGHLSFDEATDIAIDAAIEGEK